MNITLHKFILFSSVELLIMDATIEFMILPNEEVAGLYPKNIVQTSYISNAGVDIFNPRDIVIPPTGGPDQPKRVLIPLGIKAVCNKIQTITSLPLQMPWAYHLMARSSISKTGLVVANSVGLIDANYRGELMGAVYNYTSEPIKIKKGQSIFQIVAMCGTPPNVTIVTSNSKRAKEYFGDGTKEGMPTERGAKGFGSTGHTVSDADAVADPAGSET